MQGLKYVPSMGSIGEADEPLVWRDSDAEGQMVPSVSLSDEAARAYGGGAAGMVDSLYPPPMQPSTAWNASPRAAQAPLVVAHAVEEFGGVIDQSAPPQKASSSQRSSREGVPVRPSPRQSFPQLTPGRGGIPTPRHSGNMSTRRSGHMSARSTGSRMGVPDVPDEPVSLTEDDCVQLDIYHYGKDGQDAPRPEFGDEVTLALVVREYDESTDGGDGPVILRRGVENPFKFTFGGASASDYVVEGLEVGLPMLPLGCKANLFCHADYAAGFKDGDGNDVVNKHLVMDLEVLDVRKSWMLGGPGPVTESVGGAALPIRQEELEAGYDGGSDATSAALLTAQRVRATRETVAQQIAENARNGREHRATHRSAAVAESTGATGGIGRFTMSDGVESEAEVQRKVRNNSILQSLKAVHSSIEDSWGRISADASFRLRNDSSRKLLVSNSMRRRPSMRRNSSIYRARNSLFASPLAASALAALRGSGAQDSWLARTRNLLFERRNSFFIFTEGNSFRRKCHSIVKHKVFEGIILTLICIGGIFLAMDDPRLDEKSTLKQVLVYTDMAFTSVFTVEMLLKQIAFGFVLHEGAYWRNPWNMLDGTIVCASLASLSGSESLSIVRVFRLLRVLRPLRMISRVKGMQVVVNTVIHAFPSIINVVMFGVFQTCVFAILLTQMFNGRLGRCNDFAIDGVAVTTRDECTPEKALFVCNLDEGDVCEVEEHGTLVERRWFSPYMNFDHIGESLKSLFVLTTLDGWVDVAHNTMDAKGVDMVPQRNVNALLGSFSVLGFVILGSIFWPYLFIGTLVDHYLKVVQKDGPSVLETSMQAEAMERRRKERVVEQLAEYYRLSKEPKLLPPRMAIRRQCFKLVTSTPFDYFIVVCILANTACMAVTFRGMGPELEFTLEIVNFVFNGVFMLEAVLKLTGLGWEQYNRSTWNRFDLFLIVVNFPEFFITVGAGLTVFRVVRIGRLFRLLKRAKGLRALFESALTALPSIANVSSLLFLLVFMYAVLGMNLFGTGRLAEASHPRLSGDFKFEGFGNSLIALWRAFTGDEWSAMMRSAANCKVGRPCPSPMDDVLAMAYFSSFLILARYVLLNLIVAVLLEKFLHKAKEENLLEVDTFFSMVRKRFLLDKFQQKMKLAASGSAAKQSQIALKERIEEKRHREETARRKEEERRNRPRPLQGPFPKSIRTQNPKWLVEHVAAMRAIVAKEKAEGAEED